MQTEKLERCNLCGSGNIKPFDEPYNIVTCSDCGYIFDSPRPAFEEISRYYSLNDKYDPWLQQEKEREDLWQRRLELVKKYCASGKLLDVGTGIGQFLHFARSSYEVTGTEISKCAVEIAKDRYGLDIIRGEIEDIEWNEQFDVITLFHVFEHVPYPAETLETIKKLLKPGGVLILAVPNDTRGLRPLIVKVLRALGIGKFRNFGPKGLPLLSLDGTLHEIHLSHFRPEVLENFLGRSGFSVLENTIDPFYVASGIKKPIHDFVYGANRLFTRIFKRNYYFTIWIAARKNDDKN